MKRNETGTAPYYKFDRLSQCCGIKHFISTRHGGLSDGAFDSLNVGLGTGDEAATVLENRQILAASVNIPLESFVTLNQVHNTTVSIVTSDMKGQGAFDRNTAIQETDAVITNECGICLFVMAADCVPILLYDPQKNVIGAVHAGWRGTVKQIVFLTVQKMQEAFGCNPADIIAGIGPSIGPCCYTIGSDVIDAVLHNFKTTEGFINCGSDNLPYFDLWYANRKQLMDAGIPDEQIETSGICTMCEHDKFFSFRHGKGITGRFGAGIMLK